jgi:YebC/PmpR family DNA-binding regulatory protein
MGRAFEVRKVAMAKTAAAKSKVYAKYGKELYMAAKSGNPDPETNTSLKRVIERAKKDQVPADVIKRAIEKAKGGVGENYTAVTYEGFGPSNSQLIIECLTDNVNRTIASMRAYFKKVDAKIGVSGSVLHQFDHLAVFSVKASEDEVFEVLLSNDLNVTDVEVDDELVTVYANPSDYGVVRDTLVAAGYELVLDEITYLPLTTVEITNADELTSFERLINFLNEDDDVQDVYHNVAI